MMPYWNLRHRNWSHCVLQQDLCPWFVQLGAGSNCCLAQMPPIRCRLLQYRDSILSLPLMPARHIFEHKLDSLQCVSCWEYFCRCVSVLSQSWQLRWQYDLSLGFMAYYPFNPNQMTVDMSGNLGSLTVPKSSPLSACSTPATGPGGSWASNCVFAM